MHENTLSFYSEIACLSLGGTFFFNQLPRGHLKGAKGISFCAYNKGGSYGTLNCTIEMVHIFGICYT